MSNYFYASRETVSVRLSGRRTNSQTMMDPLEDIGDCACSSIPDTPRFDVFLSHSSVDKSWASKLKNDLQRYGVSAWLDQDEIRPGDRIVNALEAALDRSQAVALIVSPEAMASGWVGEEYERAVALAQNKQRQLQLIPVILRGVELPGFLANRSWVDFRDETTYDQNVWRLVWGITDQKPAQVLDLSSSDSSHSAPVQSEDKPGTPPISEEFPRKSQNANKRGTKMNQGRDGNISETTLPDLEFENREYELGRIANPAGPWLIVVDGPPRYGKTYLLKAVEEQYLEDEKLKTKWVCVRIDLANPAYENNLRAILDTISERIANKPTSHGTVSDLAGNIAGQVRDVFLLFDTADHREQETNWLVQDVIPDLIKSLKIRGRRLRVVFAGRYIFRRWAWPGYSMISLSGFDEVVVQKMIQDWVPPDVGYSYIEILGRETTFLSGGHPDSIKKILHDFYTQNWAVALDDNGLLPLEKRKQLFKDYVNPAINDILNHITDTDVRKALKVLSIFRRFNVNTIEAFQKQIVNSSCNPSDLLDQLTKTGLVRPPIPGDPFYSDAIIRNMILVQMQFTDDIDYYLELNRLAYDIYDAWIKGRDIKGTRLKNKVVDEAQVTFMVENFYHFLYCEERKRSIKEIEEKLKSYLPKLRSAFSPAAIPDLKRLLEASLRRDLDIRRRLREWIGETEIDDLLDRVFSEKG